jgi:hypothetical protein
MSFDLRSPVLRVATVLQDRQVASRADARDRDPAWWARRLGLALALGVGLGIATQRSTGLGPAVNQAIATSTGPWAIVAALIGRWAPDVRTAVVTATICLWSATVAFYAAGGPPGAGGTPGLWLAVIVVVGPVLGWLGRASVAHGALGSLAASVIAGWLLGEALHTALGHQGGYWLASGWTRDAVRWHVHAASSRWFSVAVDAIAAACWLIGSPGPRRLAAAAVVPMTVVAVAALAVAAPLLGPTVR